MSICFLLDENIPYALIAVLEERGFSVEHLKKIGMAGIKNGEVYKLAEKKKMWIITRDADFQSYYKYISHDVSGIIIIKLTAVNTHHILRTMRVFLDQYKEKLSEKHLIIIEDEVIRIY